MSPNKPAGQKLIHALQVCILALVAATVLVYPVCLSESVLAWLTAGLDSKSVSSQILPWISCGLTPLLLKESVLLSFTAVLLFLYTWIKIRGQWLGIEKSAFGDGAGFRFWVKKPEIWTLLFIVYLAASVAWSPIFQQSLQTWILCAAGAAVFLICRSSISDPHFTRKFMSLVIMCGAIAAILALLQHLDYNPLLPGSSDPRNRMSSLIGHNTGISSWLMFPLAFALYFVFSSSSRSIRSLNILFVTLFAFIIIAAQSRAIWLLSVILIPGLSYKLLKIRNLHLKPVYAIMAIAVFAGFIALLTIAPKSNRFARLPVSLEQRTSNDIFNLDQLRRETRLRILTVSAVKLIPRAPLFGTGLGSFSWVYPVAQGEYFNEHPDSILGTTTRRTDLAHNDYLQLIVETGLIGFLLLGGCLVTFCRQSYKRYRSFNNADDKSEWLALTAPLICVGIHALVDFPFHVAPIAITAVVAAALSSISRLNIQSSTSEIPVHDYRNAGFIALAATCIFFAWLPWGWSAMVGRLITSDVYFNIGQKYLYTNQAAAGQNLDYRLTLLDQSRRAFREAVVRNVFNGEAYEGQATAYVNKASYTLHGYQQLKATVDETSATQLTAIRNIVESDAQAAISVLQNQVTAGGLRYHYTYYLLGRAYAVLWELKSEGSQPRESMMIYDKALDSYRTSLQYNPVDSMTLKELTDLLRKSPGNEQEVAELETRLFEKDPWAATDLILQPAIDAAAAGEISKAHETLDYYFQKMSNNPRVLMAKAWLAFYEAVWPPAELDSIDRESDYLEWRRSHLQAGQEALSALPGNDGDLKPVKMRLEMLYAAASDDIGKANKISTDIVETNQWDREALAIKYWTDQKLHGGDLKLEDSVEYYRTRALLAIYFMDNRRSGLSLGELVFRSPLSPAEARRLTAFCIANNWRDFLAKILPQIRKTYPGDPVFAEQAKKLTESSQ